jgi:phosphate transport system substrate-binding protein
MRINRAQLVLSFILAAGISGLGLLQAQTAQVRAKVSTVIPVYEPKAQVKGALDLIGTDALSDLGDEWSSAFRKFHPGSNLIYRPKLTTDAVKNLIDGTTLLIITARVMTADETKAFQTKFEYMPMRIPVCLDANIVFVNKNNPIASITMDQLDAIYSKTRLSGAKAAALTWGDLGVKGEWEKLPILAYTRQSTSATYASVLEKVALNGELRADILERADDSALAEVITTDRGGIAIGTMASWYFANKVLPVVPAHMDDARFPDQDNITTSRYPMPRLYYIYLNRTPGVPLPAPTNELVHFLLSLEGQNSVADSGLLPGPPEFLQIAIKRLNR